MKQFSEQGFVVSRLRCVVGLLAGVLLLLSGVAHSLAGWPPQRDVLIAAQAAPELISNPGAGWHFGGVAMLAFGGIVLVTFAQAWRGRASSLWQVALIAVAYLAFGGGVWAISGKPGFAAFVALGLMLAFAAWPARRKSVE